MMWRILKCTIKSIIRNRIRNKGARVTFCYFYRNGEELFPDFTDEAGQNALSVKYTGAWGRSHQKTG